MNYMKVHGLLLLNIFNSMYGTHTARITPYWEDAGVLFLNVADKVCYGRLYGRKYSKYFTRLFMLFLCEKTFSLTSSLANAIPIFYANNWTFGGKIYWVMYALKGRELFIEQRCLKAVAKLSKTNPLLKKKNQNWRKFIQNLWLLKSMNQGKKYIFF